MLDLIDSLKEAIAPPQIVEPPENGRYPLGLLRGAEQRHRLRDYLDSLVERARDTSVKRSLRLAVFSAGKAADEFGRAADELYTAENITDIRDTTDTGPANTIEIVSRRWVEHRLEAADRLFEVIRWDRQMLAALREITTARHPFRK